MNEGKRQETLNEKRFNSFIDNSIKIDGTGHTVIQDSSLDNARISPAIEIDNNASPTKPPKRSVLEIIAWIISIGAGLVAVYEFVIKQLLS